MARFGYEPRYVVSGLPTLDRAAIQRRPLTPHTVTQVWSSWAILLFVKERTTGFTNLTVKQLIALKNYEVDADDIVALREAGFTNLTVEQLIALKKYGE